MSDEEEVFVMDDDESEDEKMEESSEEEEEGENNEEEKSNEDNEEDNEEEEESDSDYDDLKPAEKKERKTNKKIGLDSEESKKAFLTALNRILSVEVKVLTVMTKLTNTIQDKDIIMCKNKSFMSEIQELKNKTKEEFIKKKQDELIRNQDHTLPTIADLAREKELLAIARQGVVKLFTAVTKAKQKELEKEKQETGFEVLSSIFKKKKKQKENTFTDKTWDVIKDDYTPKKDSEEAQTV